MGIWDQAARVIRDYDQTGFGFSDYRNTQTPGFGLTLISPGRVKEEVESAGMQVVAHHERGWMRQDIVIAS
jgi:hypothetical protein